MMLLDIAWGQPPSKPLLIKVIVIGSLIGLALWWSVLKLYRRHYRGWGITVILLLLLIVAILYSIAFIVYTYISWVLRFG